MKSGKSIGIGINTIKAKSGFYRQNPLTKLAMVVYNGGCIVESSLSSPSFEVGFFYSRSRGAEHLRKP